ncbi:MAG: AI-2E family transporter [Rhodospirillaceae bacterium]|jgi:predicted PurR-regulated permease PerM|nr:AI-2E family transporter [Rhodospirillaceae bacterium]MBT6116491.1 AI-2E family transporter [Rhodospirillaceae bacterium]
MSAGRQVLYWAVVLAVLVVFVYLLRSILLPFVAGMAIAYFLDPAADRLEAWGCSRTLATAVITGMFFLFVAAILLLLAPLVQAQLVDLFVKLPEVGRALWAEVTGYLEFLRASLPPEQIAKLEKELGNALGATVSGAAGMLGKVWSGGLAFFNLLSLIFITPLVAFFLLRDWDRIVIKIDSWLPRDHAATVRRLAGEIDTMLAGFVRGQAILCLILGTFYAVALSIAGLKFGLIVGLVAGLISFIPFVGAAFGLVASVGLAVVQFSEWQDIAIVAAIFVVGQAVEGNILQPKLVGDRVGLHPVWVIFALLAGGALLGFVGILLAVPLAATIGVLVRFLLAEYLKSPLYGRDGGGGQGAA